MESVLTVKYNTIQSGIVHYLVEVMKSPYKKTASESIQWLLSAKFTRSIMLRTTIPYLQVIFHYNLIIMYSFHF